MADQVILSTGAQIAELLATSAPHGRELQFDGRTLAAAVVTTAMKLSPKQKES